MMKLVLQPLEYAWYFNLYNVLHCACSRTLRNKIRNHTFREFSGLGKVLPIGWNKRVNCLFCGMSYFVGDVITLYHPGK